jgi:Pyruvate/2-oxoacid:ferredoxin oxidoreductase delta subunit
LMYAESYGQFSLGRENYQSLAPELTEVRCTDCESCSVHCPNGVRVSERLIRSQEIFG